jgi:hypothetical protein
MWHKKKPEPLLAPGTLLLLKKYGWIEAILHACNAKICHARGTETEICCTTLGAKIDTSDYNREEKIIFLLEKSGNEIGVVGYEKYLTPETNPVLFLASIILVGESEEIEEETVKNAILRCDPKLTRLKYVVEIITTKKGFFGKREMVFFTIFTLPEHDELVSLLHKVK